MFGQGVRLLHPVPAGFLTPEPNVTLVYEAHASEYLIQKAQNGRNSAVRGYNVFNCYSAPSLSDKTI